MWTKSKYKFVGGEENVCLSSDERVMESTKRGIGDEQCGTRKDISCSDPIFVIGKLCEKIKEKFLRIDRLVHVSEWLGN